MDIQTLKTFTCVAKLKNFSKVAEELNYAQSTVTMQLQKLEKELGLPLFERIGRSNYLTTAGNEFLLYAEQIIELTERAMAIGQDMKSIKGIINVGILESLLFSKFLPVLSSFKEKFPNIEVNVKIGQSFELKEFLKQNKLDIIYISTDEPLDPALKCCFKNKEELEFVASCTHPLAKAKKVSAKTIFDYSCIVTEPTGYCYKQLNKISADSGCILRHSMIIDSVAAIKELLPDSNYIGFLPGYSLNDEFSKKQLTVISSSLPRQFYYSQVLCAKSKWLSPFMEELIKEIKANQ